MSAISQLKFVKRKKEENERKLERKERTRDGRQRKVDRRVRADNESSEKIIKREFKEWIQE